MNIIKTADALQVWLEKHKVRLGTTERINGELPKYAQLPEASPDAAVTVVVLIPKRAEFLPSEIVPFATFLRSDFPDRPKAQFRETDTEQSGAEYLLQGRGKIKIDAPTLDRAVVDGPQPNTVSEQQAVVRSLTPEE